MTWHVAIRIGLPSRDLRRKGNELSGSGMFVHRGPRTRTIFIYGGERLYDVAAAIAHEMLHLIVKRVESQEASSALDPVWPSLDGYATKPIYPSLGLRGMTIGGEPISAPKGSSTARRMGVP